MSRLRDEGTASAVLLRGRAAVARQPHKLEVAGSSPAHAILLDGDSPIHFPFVAFYAKRPVEIRGVLLYGNIISDRKVR